MGVPQGMYNRILLWTGIMGCHWGANVSSWWRHQMKTFSALLAIRAGNSPVTGEFPAQRPVTRSFDVFFDLLLNKGLSKQSWGWWSEVPSCPFWRHCNEIIHRDRIMFNHDEFNQSGGNMFPSLVILLTIRVLCYHINWRCFFTCPQPKSFIS